MLLHQPNNNQIEPCSAYEYFASKITILGSTCYQPVPSSDSPDGIHPLSHTACGAAVVRITTVVPVGGSPTLPIFKASSERGGAHADARSDGLCRAASPGAKRRRPRSTQSHRSADAKDDRRIDQYDS